MKNKISIITPAYNAEKYIKRCVESVLSQTYENIEHIVVDDGSSDNTLSILNEMSKSDERLKVIHKENEGVSIARNVAIEHSNGDFIIFADADDWMEKDMCENMLSSALENDSDIVICEYYNYYESSDKKDRIKLEKIEGSSFPDLISDDSNRYGGFPWNKMIKANMIKHNFDNNIHFYENLLFFLENFDRTTKYSVVFQPLYNYCINDNSAVHSKKYNPKKLTSLIALERVIPLMNNKNKINYMFTYVNSFYSIYFDMFNAHVDTSALKKSKTKMHDYFKVLKNNKHLSNKSKIKLYIMRYFTIVFFVIKKVKSR